MTDATDGDIMEAAGKAVAKVEKSLDGDTWRSLGVERDDAVQEAAMAAVSAIEKFDGSSPLSAWMYIKAKFGLLDYVRELREARSKVAPARVVQTGLDDEPLWWKFSEVFLDDEDCSVQPEAKQEIHGADAQGKRKQLALRALLDTLMLGVLEERERQVVEMRFGLGERYASPATQASIARTLGVSQGHVSVLLASAMEKLRAEVRAERIMSL